MENELITALNAIQDPRKLFIVCSIMIFGDVLTGYLKAFKNKKVNSSVSRDGYIKKLGWFVSLILGVAVNYFMCVKTLLIGTAIVCFTTEFISVYENLRAIGVKLPFDKYFEKVKDGVDNEI